MDPLASARQELAAAPPSSFVKTRGVLVKRLRDEGHGEAAAELGKARKPSASVWVVNALARDEEAAFVALMEAGDEVRKAQRRAVSGAGADALRQSQRELGAALSRAVQAAKKRLVAQKESHSAVVLERVRSTLQAAATLSGEEREQVLRGELEEDLSPAGFGFVSPLEVVPKSEREDASSAQARKADAAARAAEEKRQKAAKARELERAKAELKKATSERIRLERLAVAAEARARVARKKADEAAAREQAAKDALDAR